MCISKEWVKWIELLGQSQEKVSPSKTEIDRNVDSSIDHHPTLIDVKEGPKYTTNQKFSNTTCELPWLSEGDHIKLARETKCREPLSIHIVHHGYSDHFQRGAWHLLEFEPATIGVQTFAFFFDTWYMEMTSFHGHISDWNTEIAHLSPG